ncbi:MAG TPA: ABC transporter ATP-binding protein [Candidatus Kryptonia bacterium]
MILTGEQLKKVYNKRVVFSNLSFKVESGQTLSVTGPNGSGKSTVSKIICGVLSPTSGKVILTEGSKTVDRDEIHRHVGFVSPYLELYGEFTAAENLEIEMRARGTKAVDGSVDEILELVGLFNRRNDELRGFSSGMKQRMKYAAALIHQPSVLVLDEPTANLDPAGIEMVYTLIDRYRKDRIVILATNDKDEASMGDIKVVLDRNPGSSGGK